MAEPVTPSFVALCRPSGSQQALVPRILGLTPQATRCRPSGTCVDTNAFGERAGVRGGSEMNSDHFIGQPLALPAGPVAAPGQARTDSSLGFLRLLPFRSAVVLSFLAFGLTAHSAWAQSGVESQILVPRQSVFSVNTTVSVPDRGGNSLGGFRGSSRWRSESWGGGR